MQIKEVVFDCTWPARLARFWAAALEGYAVRPYDEAEIARLAALGFTPETDPTVMVDGPGPTLCFQRVDKPDLARNPVHLDLVGGPRAAEVERLADLAPPCASITTATRSCSTLRAIRSACRTRAS